VKLGVVVRLAHCRVGFAVQKRQERLNRVEEAVAAYERLLVLAPNNAALLANCAAALRRLDRPHEALVSAQKALAIKPGFARARFVEAVPELGRFRRRLAGLRSALACRLARVAAPRLRRAALARKRASRRQDNIAACRTGARRTNWIVSNPNSLWRNG